MRIKATNFEAGKYYHIYNHAVLSNLLFHNYDDYNKFIQIMNGRYSKADFSLLAYCLMPNHFHFLMQQKEEAPLYVFFNKLCHEYSIYYNKKYMNKGTIFRSKLQHIEVQNEAYLGYLCAYIHLNPVKAGIVNAPHEWMYSNFSALTGHSDDSITDTKQISQMFFEHKIYEEFVKSVVLDRIDTKYMFDN
ncbi:MAG TPA: transposase [Candidatus Cloacimonadota bacterium]|mgnify:CR=1 FL=1|nr:transposase [Candidatus Cloacimonadota bacterium]HPT71624.1 transposase [Candidatus Cloacimonadota bacterium]